MFYVKLTSDFFFLGERVLQEVVFCGFVVTGFLLLFLDLRSPGLFTTAPRIRIFAVLVNDAVVVKYRLLTSSWAERT